MSLLSNRFNYQELTRNNVEGKRLYCCPDGAKVPSVTTILDQTKPLEKRVALEQWRKRVGSEKAQAITTEAANRGTRMHSYLETYIKTGAIKEKVGNPYAQQGLDMAKIVINQGLVNINEVWGSEISLYYPQLYAGTTDCVGLHNNEESILDFKQTNKPKKEEWIEDYYMQLVAYAEAHNKIYDTNIKKGVILMCSANYEYQEFILTPEKYSYWADRWWDRVEAYYKLR